ncbi:hypothetical protein FOZ62_017006, partial [Perkinsus olseni]
GMLIDTGRRYLPVDLIKKNLRTMAWVKMNVLHWHISDDISFSVQLENYSRGDTLFVRPPLGGALRKDTHLVRGGGVRKLSDMTAMYTAGEVREVVEYANKLNIKVIPEIDVPAHTTSWIRGYPFLTGEADYWMDPISERTSTMAVDVISEVVELFYRGQGRVNNGERVVHLGGDEVGDAWNTPALEQWTRDHGKFHNRTDLVDYWISHTIAEVKRRTGARVILWNDFLDDHTTQADTIDAWQIWRYNTSQTLDMAESGKFGGLIYSSAFFLDLLGDDWATFYDVPLKRDGAGVIKGGEACMWGESVDASVFMPRVWLRAAAIAERFWCADEDICPFNHEWAVNRLARTRCFLSAFVLGHTSPSDISPVGNYKDLSNPDSSYM